MARQGVDLIMLGTLHEGATAPVLAVAEEARRTNEIPLVLVVDSVASLDLGANMREITESVAASGVDGLIVYDFPPEMMEYQLRLCEEASIDFIRLVPQSGMSKHLQVTVEMASGFIYCVTPRLAKGDDSRPLHETATLVSEVRESSALPVVVDSHVGTPEHVAEASRFADGVVVSSSLIKVIDSMEGDDIILGVADYLRSLKKATRR
jgi:tryptophan synthase alpha chain